MKLLCLQYDFIWESKGLYPFSGNPSSISYFQIHPPFIHIDLASTSLLSRLIPLLLYMWEGSSICHFIHIRFSTIIIWKFWCCSHWSLVWVMLASQIITSCHSMKEPGLLLQIPVTWTSSFVLSWMTLQWDVIMTKVLKKIILVTKVTLEFLVSICPTIIQQNLGSSHSSSTLFTN